MARSGTALCLHVLLAQAAPASGETDRTAGSNAEQERERHRELLPVWNASSHADQRSHRCPSAPAMQHSRAPDGPTSSTVSHSSRRLQAEERQCPGRQRGGPCWSEAAIVIDAELPSRVGHAILTLRRRCSVAIALVSAVRTRTRMRSCGWSEPGSLGRPNRVAGATAADCSPQANAVAPGRPRAWPRDAFFSHLGAVAPLLGHQQPRRRLRPRGSHAGAYHPRGRTQRCGGPGSGRRAGRTLTGPTPHSS
jgi:hypothetical protein